MLYDYFKKYFYSFLRSFTRGGTAFGFRKIIVTGYEDIKDEGPVLFVANHQNTFMDGVILVQVAYKIRPHVLVRADIFKSKWAKILLDLIHLIPIYRRRDGVDTKTANQEIFDKCIALFKKKRSIQIFPEGNHAVERHLRPLQKGAARLAFQAESENDFNLGLKIIPVGLHYENHSERWHDAHLHFGEPIKVAKLEEKYFESEQKAIHSLTDRIKDLISQDMLDIKWKKEYQFFEDIRHFLKPYAESLFPGQKSYVHAESKMIDQLEKKFKENSSLLESFKTRLKAYYSKCEKIGLKKPFVMKKSSIIKLVYRALLLIPGGLVWALMKIINSPAEFIIESKVIKGIKDKTWHISLRTALGSFLYPIYYGLIWLVLSFLIDWTLAGVFIFTLPILSVINFEFVRFYRIFRNQLLIHREPELLQEESDLRKELIQLVLDK